MSERKHGNYHVLHGAFDGWQVAQYCEDGWLVTGIQQPIPEIDFEEIGPRIPDPDEPWQCVPAEMTLPMIAAIGFGGDEVLAVGHGAISGEVEEAYAAMLRAAPKPDQGRGENSP